jgi:hypothetical protein
MTTELPVVTSDLLAFPGNWKELNYMDEPRWALRLRGGQARRRVCADVRRGGDALHPAGRGQHLAVHLRLDL